MVFFGFKLNTLVSLLIGSFFFFLGEGNSGTCLYASKNRYHLYPENSHRLCLMNEYSERPPQFVKRCVTNPDHYLKIHHKLIEQEVDHQTLCTDKFIILDCQKDPGYIGSPKFQECLRILKTYNEYGL